MHVIKWNAVVVKSVGGILKASYPAKSIVLLVSVIVSASTRRSRKPSSSYISIRNVDLSLKVNQSHHRNEEIYQFKSSSSVGASYQSWSIERLNESEHKCPAAKIMTKSSSPQVNLCEINDIIRRHQGKEGSEVVFSNPIEIVKRAATCPLKISEANYIDKSKFKSGGKS